MKQRSLALQVGPDHMEQVVLYIAVGEKVIVFVPDSLVLVALVVGLKLGVQNQQPVAELVLGGHPRARQNGVKGTMRCC